MVFQHRPGQFLKQTTHSIRVTRQRVGSANVGCFERSKRIGNQTRIE